MRITVRTFVSLDGWFARADAFLIGRRSFEAMRDLMPQDDQVGPNRTEHQPTGANDG